MLEENRSQQPGTVYPEFEQIRQFDEDMNEFPVDPSRPVPYLEPGSSEKVAVLAQRVKMGLPLHLSGDRTISEYFDPLVNEGPTADDLVDDESGDEPDDRVVAEPTMTELPVTPSIHLSNPRHADARVAFLERKLRKGGVLL